MEYADNVGAMAAETIRQENYHTGEMILRAYLMEVKLENTESRVGRQFGFYELAMAKRAIAARPSHVIGQQMLPIEFSKQGEK